MAGLVPAIHVLCADAEKRGCPAQGRHDVVGRQQNPALTAVR